MMSPFCGYGIPESTLSTVHSAQKLVVMQDLLATPGRSLKFRHQIKETRIMTEADGEGRSSIGQFYHGKTVFITGATGLMGKVLVEKLLRSTSLAKIFLLIRPKKDTAAQIRLKNLMETPIFNKLRMEDEEALRKVVAMSGDITEDRLGLTFEEESILVNSVNIIFHCAATVRFDETLSVSVGVNVAGLGGMLSLAKKMNHLEAMVHVSTAYCNDNQTNIEERIYKPPGNPRGMVELCQWMDPEIINNPEVMQKIVGDRPNNYSFTKALAESLLASESNGLPIAVMRPSIVAASWKEPMPGWVDNLKGPSGVIAGIGKGVLRTIYCRRNSVADLVPVDVCINFLCAIAWETANSGSGKPIKVYNCTSGSLNPITWGQMEVLLPSAIKKAAFEGTLWAANISAKKNLHINKLHQLLFHYGPALWVDLFCRLLGRQPFLTRVSDMMQKLTKAYEPYTTATWTWNSDNLLSLEASLTEEDRRTFGFDMRGLHWPAYLDHYCQGIRDFVFQDSTESQVACRRKLKWLNLVDSMVKGFVLLLVAFLLYRLFF